MGREERDGGGQVTIPHTITATREELIAELELVKAQRDELRTALDILYHENADYIKINNLGPVLHNQSMKLAWAALNPEVSK